MFHQSHSTILRPAFFVVVTDDVLVVRIWVLCEVSPDEFSGFVCCKFEDDVDSVNVSHVDSDRVSGLGLD